jgi:hypothetical protein
MMWKERVLASFSGTIPSFACRDFGIQWKTTVRIASVPAEIRTTAPAENKAEALLAEPAYSVRLGHFEIETCNEYKPHPLCFSFL